MTPGGQIPIEKHYRSLTQFRMRRYTTTLIIMTILSDKAISFPAKFLQQTV